MPESDTTDPVFFQRKRARMVGEQIAGDGVRDERVLDAMRRVPREAFVTPSLAADAYEDGPLPIDGYR